VESKWRQNVAAYGCTDFTGDGLWPNTSGLLCAQVSSFGDDFLLFNRRAPTGNVYALHLAVDGQVENYGAVYRLSGTGWPPLPFGYACEAAHR